MEGSGEIIEVKVGFAVSRKTKTLGEDMDIVEIVFPKSRKTTAFQ